MTDNTESETLVLLTPAEVCRRLGIGSTRFNHLVASGQLAVVRLGASRRVRSDELTRFFESLTRAGDHQA